MNLFDNIQNGWRSIIDEELSESYIIKLNEFLDQEYDAYTIYPPRSEIFTSFSQTDYNEVKVVIIGQDPYHKENQANGLAFAVSDDVFPKPPSLRRILDEVERNFDQKLNRKESSLLGWARQGVLLLNTSLTVRSAVPASHSKKGWEKFTDKIISKLAERDDPIIFLLWGRHAKAKSLLIKSPHIVLTAPHPSPLADGFPGCEHFKKANEILTSLGKDPIDWCQIT